jgi:hypothetical protein
MEIPDHQRSSEYSYFAFVSMIVFFAMFPVAIYLHDAHVDLNDWVKALLWLSFPLTAWSWVAFTIKDLHARDLSFWNLRSTHVSLGIGFVVILGLLVAGWAQSTSGALAVAIGLIGYAVWALIYNFLKTKHVLTALCLTLIQVLVGLLALLVALSFYMRSLKTDPNAPD